ncbi:MAG: TonB family protein [Oligoflexia bacterium]|nr:TonB family protein [Oligoflexia bacterium]
MKDQSKLSWFLSVAFHAGLAAAIVYTGINIATPGGEVGEPLTVDVSGGGTEVQIPNPPAGAPAPVVQAIEPQKEDAPTIAQKLPPAAPPAKVIQEAPPAQPLDDDGDMPVARKEVAPTPDETTEQSEPEETPEPKKPDLPQPVPVAQKVEPVREPEPEPEPERPAEPTTNAVVEDAKPTNEPIGVPGGSGGSEQKAMDTSGGQAGAGGGPGTGAPPAMNPGNTLQASQVREIPGNPKPEYPWMAKLKGKKGAVVVSGFLRANNRFSHIALVRSSGHPELDKAALDAFQKWKYQYPGKDTWVIKPFNFTLNP